MKKLGIMFVMTGIVAFGLSSCGTDPDVAKPTPKFDFKTGLGYTSANGNVTAGSTVKIGIEATGSENLQSVGVRTQVGTAQQGTLNLTASGDSNITSLKTKDFSLEFTYQVGSLPTTEKITVIVTMSNGESTQKTITLTVTATPKNLTEAPGRQIGGQSNATYGSYYSMETNTAELQASANANPAAIDWVYYYGSGNLATFAAPDDPTLQSSNVMNNPSLTSWSVKNATRFKKLPGFDFDGATTSTDLQTEISKGAPNLTALTQMQIGEVYLFVTAGSKEYGIIKIISNSAPTSAGFVTFDMKFVSEQ